MTAEENGTTYWQGRMEAKLEAIVETLRNMELGDLRRHSENKDRLDHLQEEMAEMREWRSYIKGVAVAWAAGSSVAFSSAAELLRYVLAKH